MTDGDIGMTWELTDNQEGDENVGLIAFSSAAAAQRIRGREQGPRDEKYAEDLEKLYPGFKENFIQSRFMDWPGEKWTMAGYSAPAPGQIMSCGAILYNGIGRLHFAGEHSSFSFPGYMEGALNAGASLAKRMVAKHEAQPAEKKPATV
jgi:monoamine oxidase